MDPVAHTLFGATLAETGLRKKTALATASLIIGANLPDIDAVAMFWGNDYSLFIRRGWTHGILALAILPLLLTGSMLLFDRFRNQWGKVKESNDENINGGSAGYQPVKIFPLLMLSYLAVLSHPALDWLNTYGVRLLMPFSGKWFYGDVLFIIDPWMWLLMGATVVLARSGSKWSIAGWIALGASTTALVTGTAVVPSDAKILWCIGITVIIFTRWTGWFRGRTIQTGKICMMTFGIYLLIQFTGAKISTSQAKSQLKKLGIETVEIMSDPQPAHLFLRGGVAVSESYYYCYRINWLDRDSFELVYDPLPIEGPDRIVRVALKSPEVRGLTEWIRFPYYETEELDNGWRVIIRDLRYVSPDQMEADGIGLAVVELDQNLQSISK
jgi:inner membrane protein